MPDLSLDRQILTQFLPNHRAIVAFENLQSGVFVGLPSTIEEAAAQAALATAFAQQALSMLGDVLAGLEQLQAAPPAIPVIEKDELAPRPELGTISSQNAESVDITGGTIGLDAGTVGAPSLYFGGDITTGVYRIALDNLGLSIAGVKLADFSATAAAFTQNVSTTKQLISTLAIGTAPLVVTSTTKVTNLNADLLDDSDWASPSAIGTGTPANGTFVDLSATAKFGCNGAAVQSAAASGGSVVTTGATNIAPFGYTTAAQADDIVTKLNNVISALVANGIMS